LTELCTLWHIKLIAVWYMRFLWFWIWRLQSLGMGSHVPICQSNYSVSSHEAIIFSLLLKFTLCFLLFSKIDHPQRIKKVALRKIHKEKHWLNIGTSNWITDNLVPWPSKKRCCSIQIIHWTWLHQCTSAYTVINMYRLLLNWILLDTITARCDTDIWIFVLKRLIDTNLWLWKTSPLTWMSVGPKRV
jgi:hypothetical protein